MVPCAHSSQPPNVISVSLAVFARHIRVTNTQAHGQAMLSVTAIGHIYAVQPKTYLFTKGLKLVCFLHFYSFLVI